MANNPARNMVNERLRLLFERRAKAIRPCFMPFRLSKQGSWCVALPHRATCQTVRSAQMSGASFGLSPGRSLQRPLRNSMSPRPIVSFAKFAAPRKGTAIVLAADEAVLGQEPSMAQFSLCLRVRSVSPSSAASSAPRSTSSRPEGVGVDRLVAVGAGKVADLDDHGWLKLGGVVASQLRNATDVAVIADLPAGPCRPRRWPRSPPASSCAAMASTSTRRAPTRRRTSGRTGRPRSPSTAPTPRPPRRPSPRPKPWWTAS